MNAFIKKTTLASGLLLAILLGVTVNAAPPSRILSNEHFGFKYRSLSDEGEVIGVQIMQVKLGSVAEIMGLRANDILMGIDDQPVTNESVKTIGNLYAPGEEVVLRVARGHHNIQLSSKMPALGRSSNEPAFLGVEVINGDRDQLGTEITSVIDGSAADHSGLITSDIILGVNNEPVVGANLKSLLASHHAGDVVTLHVVRGKKQMELNVILGNKVDPEAI